MNPAPPSRTSVPGRDERLESWKEIASYLRRSERTVHRWEEREGLPVHRLIHEKRGSVYAYKRELDAWRAARKDIAAPETPVVEVKSFRAGHRAWLWAVPACILAVVAGLAAGRWVSPSADSGRGPSVAILPLENVSGDPEQEYFVDGMTDELITQLAKTTSFHVISRTSAMRYKKSLKPLALIAKELKVDTVVEGEVLRSGDRVRITAQLIRADTDRHLWAETYERDLRDVLAVQDEVAQAIAAQIRAKLVPAERRPGGRRPVRTDVHDAYLKGRFHLNHGTEEEIQSAIGYFRQAVQADPDFARAYAGIADSYVALTDFYLAPSDTMPKAKEAALHALRLDDGIAESHMSLAVIRFVYDWDWAAAEREFRRSLDLEPSSADTHTWYAVFLGQMARHREALAETERAEQLDPLSPAVYLNASWVHYLAHRDDQVTRSLQMTLDLEPNFPLTHSGVWLGYAPNVYGHGPILASLESLQPNDASPLMLAILAGFDATLGKKEEARRLLARLEVMSKERYVCPYEMAAAHTALRQKEQAYNWLEKAYHERSLCLPDLKTDPRFDALRADSRFRDLLRRVGF